MNKLIAILALGVCFGNVSAKSPKKDKASEEGFVFTTVKENPITSVKDQNRSSTCWAFSTLGFLEAELLRAGKGEFDLSEMFVVHHTMQDCRKKPCRVSCMVKSFRCITNWMP